MAKYLQHLGLDVPDYELQYSKTLAYLKDTKVNFVFK